MTDTQHLDQAAIYTVTVSREPSNVWTADVVDLGGAHTYANDRDQLDANVREVIALVNDLPKGHEDTLAIDYQDNDMA